jgi:hypothetical protein
MVGKWAIHPKQIAPAEVFTPPDEAVAEAREIPAAAAEASARRRGDRLQRPSGGHRQHQTGRSHRQQSEMIAVNWLTDAHLTTYLCACVHKPVCTVYANARFIAGQANK